MSDRASQLANLLQQITKGLQWMSESDYPFEVVAFESPSADLTPENVLQLTKHDADVPVESVDLDSFFAVATQEQDWHSAAEQETVKQYQKLVSCLKEHLRDLQVYRIGEINLEIYILGKTEEGELAGLSTQAVET